MAKVDKELLKKHHFWFLFIPIALGFLIAWIGLISEVDGEIDTKKTEIDGNLQKTAKNNAKAKKTLDKFKEQTTELDKKKLVLWKDGWEKQKDVYVWPSGYSREQLEVVNKAKFGEEIPESESVHSQFKEPKIYMEEYIKLVELLKPVQFLENDWKKALNRSEQDWGAIPDSEDMWLAMEDLWVQRELLMAIHRVNEAAAKMQKKPAPDGKDDPKHRWFANRTWELELWIDDEKGQRILKGKLKNISERLQVMGIGNLMQMKVDLKPSGKEYTFDIQGTDLEAGMKEPMLVKTIDSHKLPADWIINEIADVRQIFDARTVPIKRIDAVAIPRVCDRNKDMPLRANVMSLTRIMAEKKKIEAAAAAGTTTTSTAAASPTEASATVPAPTGLAPMSQDKLRRYRYVDVIAPKQGDKPIEQMRRLPVAISLVTDQAYLNDIEAALLNVRLPMQIVQEDWTRFHDSVDYKFNTAPAAGSIAPVAPVGGIGQSGTPATSRDDQFTANLMNLTVYGVLSLYDPYEEKPAKK